MVFNVLIRNRDDHAKNFSFQHINGEWKLSPAYDLLPSRGFNGFHTTTVNGSGDPSERDILKVAEKANLNAKRAEEILEEVRLVLSSEL
jgi:serine/threonine-protein kinase HipA